VTGVSILLYYNLRNLLARRLSTSLTLVVIAVMVFVLGILLSFAAGMQATLASTGSPLNIIVLKPGATAESTSIILPEEAAQLAQTPGLANDANGRPLLSRELCVQTDLPRRNAARSAANVAIRGVEEVAFVVHPEVRIVAGRPFQQGALELIAGQAAVGRFHGLEVGSRITIGRQSHRQYTVVGIFTAGGGALESEIWAPRTMLADSYQRQLSSSVLLRLRGPEFLPEALAYINGPSVQLTGKSETAYYDDLASTTREVILLTTVLIGIMAVGAVFAVANTMYAAVDGRRRELAMLRAIGFRRVAIMAALLSESLLLSLVACVAGCLAAAAFSGLRQDFLSNYTWTVLAFELRMTSGVVAACVGLAVVVGVAGALAPGVRAARVNVLEALRKA